MHLLANYQMIMADQISLFLLLLFILKKHSEQVTIPNLHQQDHCRIITMELKHKRNSSEYEMQWTKHNLPRQYLPDTWSFSSRWELSLNHNQNHWPIFVCKTKKREREKVKKRKKTCRRIYQRLFPGTLLSTLQNSFQFFTFCPVKSRTLGFLFTGRFKVF